MPSSNVPLNFNRDRTERQLDARLDELLEKLRKNRPSEDPWMVRRAYEIAAERHRGQNEPDVEQHDRVINALNGLGVSNIVEMLLERACRVCYPLRRGRQRCRESRSLPRPAGAPSG